MGQAYGVANSPPSLSSRAWLLQQVGGASPYVLTLQAYEQFADGTTCYNTTANILFTDGGADSLATCSAAKGGCALAYNYVDYYPTSPMNDSSSASENNTVPALVGFKGLAVGPFTPGAPNLAKVRHEHTMP